MESDNQLDDEKVVREFNRRALLHKDENAVLDAYDAHEIKRHNVYRNFVHKKMVNSNLRPGKEDVLLDYGCGVGRFAMLLSPLVRKVIGVDTAGDMIGVANDRLNKSKISNI
ncbi:MAG: methyltransferase domain-containing protein, partial [Flavobacteriales bacterium]|nr:methyltransferase domain-containing protein [Flavobacteriales bacterium]